MKRCNHVFDDVVGIGVHCVKCDVVSPMCEVCGYGLNVCQSDDVQSIPHPFTFDGLEVQYE